MRNFIFIVFAGCRGEVLLKNHSFTSISQGFSKTCIPVPCTWNSEKPNKSGYFYHHLYITHVPLSFQILGVPFL